MMQPKAKSSPLADPSLKGRIRFSLFAAYLNACVKIRANPWNYFALNQPCFNFQKGLFSKLDIDSHIPDQFRLVQTYYNKNMLPDRLPVFAKPEWGQNSKGIHCIHTPKAFLDFGRTVKKTRLPYLVQQAAPGKNEYEIYYLRSTKDMDSVRFLSLTQVLNNKPALFPINSIHNPHTRYTDLTPGFSNLDKIRIWKIIKNIGHFPLARVGLKADSVSHILQSKFKILEINLFLPMPLVLFCDNVTWNEKKQIIKTTMTQAARLVKALPEKADGRRIFFKKFMKTTFGAVS